MNTQSKNHRPMRLKSAMRSIAPILTAMFFVSASAWADDSGKCGENVTWTYTESTQTLAITGSGNMDDYSSANDRPYNSYIDNIQIITIGDGVTKIGKYAFNSCLKLTSVTIPTNVKSIGWYAFSESGLASISFAEGSQLTSIGARAFYRCSELTSITIPANVTSIGDYAFCLCGFSSVAFAKNTQLTSISNYAFADCSELASITIPASVTTIGESAFYLSGLYSIVFAEGSQLTSIGNSAFKKCSGLTSISIPASVTSIGELAFAESGLTSVAFAENSQLTSIGFYAFYNCSGLTSITIPASVTSIGGGAFSESGLTSITINSTSLTNYGHCAFDNNAEGRKIYVPEESVDTYKTGWPDCADDILPISAKPTSIGNATMPSGNAQAADEAWYSLSGRKLKGKPTERGVYLHQGRKVVVK